MDSYTMALFGEAEKGEFSRGCLCDSVVQFFDFFGNPPPFSRGIYYAVQAFLYHQHVLFFRVQEEGMSRQDYLLGLNLLRRQDVIPDLSAICLPGVGSHEILEATTPICAIHHSLLITNESDLYDYLTE